MHSILKLISAGALLLSLGCGVGIPNDPPPLGGRTCPAGQGCPEICPNNPEQCLDGGTR